MRRLGYLQLDPISTVAPPQHLVLFSRLGLAYDRAELDRLLWQDKQLFEWSAFLWPRESLPIVLARMRRRNQHTGAWRQRVSDFLTANEGFRRYLLRELRPETLARPLRRAGSPLGAERWRLVGHSQRQPHPRNVAPP